ncbi:small conductance mechanosensitive channel [Motilibacter peucedani]|uniref:Small conductance mechanosensitive channel n=1 Tax=Motilibacter peucedani TaxID=598650 RepID=A0A420XNN9_9ACTN|nr:mechanosensitive ion channel family protein [Motilibacter peucedani]RKS73807.1 small conductance mechanosensitive channel [Motilibacter peucedani]
MLVRLVLHRLISGLVARAAEGTVPGVLAKASRASIFESSPLLSERRSQRVQTMGSVLRSIVTGIVVSIAVLMVLSEVGLDIAPLLASVSIVGVALGFGAQSLVKDFLSGVFIIVEDQFGVGDVVDLGPATGVVEAVGLRVTRIRDVNGTVWYVRNGEILRVGNMSQGWARAVIDVPVAPDSDVARVKALLAAAASSVAADPELSSFVLEEPEVWGVETMSLDSVVVRLVVKTQPLQQWAVARELRQRVREALSADAAAAGSGTGLWAGAAAAGAPPSTVPEA